MFAPLDELNVPRKSAPTIEVSLRTRICFLVRGITRVPCSIDVMVEVLHVDAELPEIIFGIRLHVTDELVEGFERLFQILDEVYSSERPSETGRRRKSVLIREHVCAAEKQGNSDQAR